MISYKGWVSINTSLDEEEDFKKLGDSIKKISELLKPLLIHNNFFQLIEINGEYILWIGGNHNHDNNYSQDVLTLLNNIGHIAVGSYGIIYLNWPEDENNYDKFITYELTNGVVKINDSNSFLSLGDKF